MSNSTGVPHFGDVEFELQLTPECSEALFKILSTEFACDQFYHHTSQILGGPEDGAEVTDNHRPADGSIRIDINKQSLAIYDELWDRWLYRGKCKVINLGFGGVP